MGDEDLTRALQSVGMAAFVAHLDLFDGPLPHGAAAAELQHRMGITAKASLSRTSKARAILKAGLRDSALERIVASTRASDAARDAARRLLAVWPDRPR